MAFKIADHLCYSDGQVQSCILPDEKYCFSARGSARDVEMAWEILCLIARYRLAQTVIDMLYTNVIVPVSASNDQSLGHYESLLTMTIAN